MRCKMYMEQEYMEHFPFDLEPTTTKDEKMNNKPTLYIIRGLPGSGKSTLAGGLSRPNKCWHIEADMFFIDNKGAYKFNPSLLGEAHKWCQEQCREYLKQGFDVAVSNTFVKLWEMKPYLDMKHLANISVIECKNNFGNTHGVSSSVIERMRRNWEEYNKQPG